mgnify:CR=1 FL=1
MTRRTIFAILAVSGAIACSDQSTIATGLNPNGLKPSRAVGVGGGTIFGPAECLRTTGKPFEVPFTFAGQDGGAATLTVIDNGVLGLNGTIELNGVIVVNHPAVGGNEPLNLTVPITTAASNTLVCKLEGKPGSGLTLSVTQ